MLLVFILVFLFIPLVGEQSSPSLASLNIVTMVPQEAFAVDAPVTPAFTKAAKGVKRLIGDIRAKKALNATIVATNSRAKKKRLIKVHSGVPKGKHSYDKKTIFIYSTGWLVGTFGGKTVSDGFANDIHISVSGGVGAFHVYNYIAGGILNGPTVAFDYPTDVRTQFNIGQDDDLKWLKLVYDQVVLHNPGANIVLVGDCKGATAILNLLTHPKYAKKLPQVKAVIAESPPLSLSHVADSIANGYIWYVPYSNLIVSGIMQAGLPAYRNNGPGHIVTQAAYDDIPISLPILIGHIEDESLVDNGYIKKMVYTLTKTGNSKVHFYVSRRFIKDKATDEDERLIQHGRLNKVPEFQYVANAFLRAYGLSHDAALADDGIYLLAQSAQ